MSTETPASSSTSSSPRGLATVALLKARFDEKVDQLDLFLPLVIDTVDSLSQTDFIAADVQEALRARHGIIIPQHTLGTLLQRLVKKRVLSREFARYKKLGKVMRGQDVLAKKTAIENEQSILAQEFRSHAATREVVIDSDESALSMILTFLEDNQVAMLLGTPQYTVEENRLNTRESRLVAEFVNNIFSTRPELARIFQNILEGLVVYNTAFLRDVTSTVHNLTGLRVYIDTNIAFQALGYEGVAQETLTRETLNLLRSAGVQCLIFDRTIYEMQSVLKVHESRLGTSQGVKSLRPAPMARYMVTNRYSPSDIRQMSALLPKELGELGIQIAPIPKHAPQYTLDEKKLGEYLSDKPDQGADDPRVIHDVHCAAAILTLRKGAQSNSIANVKAVFVSSSKMVISKVQRWYKEEGEEGIGPIVHIRALSNLVWVRRPALAAKLKAHELIALCHAALQPSRKTWDRFLQHLNRLESNHTLTTDEAVAVVVSELTDDLLGDIEDGDVDAVTLDEVVERVRAHYEAEAKKRLEEQETETRQRLAQEEAELRRQLEEERSASQKQFDEMAARAQKVQPVVSDNKHTYPVAEEYRQLRLRVEGKATRLTQLITKAIYLSVVILVIVGAVALIVGHPLHAGVLGIVVGAGLAIFITMELFGILEHASHLRSKLEAYMLPKVRRALGADESPRPQLSFLGLDSPRDEPKE
jgi:predicted transcriptional regulator